MKPILVAVALLASTLSVVVLLAGCGGSSSPTAPTPPAPATVAAIFLTPNGVDLPVGGGSTTIEIVTAASLTGGASAPNVLVSLTSSDGSLSAPSVRTNADGRASVTWSGEASALVTARAGDIFATAAMRVAAPPAPPPPPTPTPTPAPEPNPVPPPPPTPTPRPPYTLNLGASIDTAGSHDYTFSAGLTSTGGPLPQTMTVSWDFNGDGAIDATTTGGLSADPNPPYNYPHATRYTFGAAGSYTARATAVTSDGTTLTATLPVTVK
jgi:hypothetical protein